VIVATNSASISHHAGEFYQQHASSVDGFQFGVDYCRPARKPAALRFGRTGELVFSKGGRHHMYDQLTNSAITPGSANGYHTDHDCFQQNHPSIRTCLTPENASFSSSNSLVGSFLSPTAPQNLAGPASDSLNVECLFPTPNLSLTISLRTDRHARTSGEFSGPPAKFADVEKSLTSKRGLLRLCQKPPRTQ